MLSYEGSLHAQGYHWGLVVARFNRPISQSLLKGAIEGLISHGAREENLSVVWVPGAFEIPLVAKKMSESKRYDAVICLGAIIRGETAHFDYVAQQAASGILQASLSTGVPLIFSVLTTENVEQAEKRAEIKENNIGFKGALAAIEMVNLLKDIK